VQDIIHRFCVIYHVGCNILSHTMMLSFDCYIKRVYNRNNTIQHFIFLYDVYSITSVLIWFSLKLVLKLPTLINV